jgi:5'-AMP-activated protein kinase catalytic alpha subunit
MQRMHHPSIVNLYEVVDSVKRLVLVLDYASGGDLCKYVRAKRRLEEDESRKLLAQIACGIHYCHANNVVHRDIKLENCLLDSQHNCKIVDFGFSTIFKQGQRLKTFCGSPSYAAPEIISRKPYNGPPVDVWSLGVLLFGMLAGYFPFQGDTANDLYRRVLRGEFKSPSSASPEARDLLRRMLCVDPTRRATIVDVLAHPWTAVAFREATHGGGPAAQHEKRYMQRLVAHIRDQDTMGRKSGPGAAWWWAKHDVNAMQPTVRRNGFVADAAKDGALADTRLGEMLGTRPRFGTRPR